MLKKLKFLKKPLFQSDNGHAISRQEKRRLPKSTTRFPAKKRWHSLPPLGCLGTPLPLPQSPCRRTDVRTEGHMIITSQPKFLRLIGYQISLAMELHWRALPAGSAIIFADTSGLFSGDRFINVLNFVSVLPSKIPVQISGNGFQNRNPKYIPYSNAKK